MYAELLRQPLPQNLVASLRAGEIQSEDHAGDEAPPDRLCRKPRSHRSWRPRGPFVAAAPGIRGLERGENTIVREVAELSSARPQQLSLGVQGYGRERHIRYPGLLAPREALS